MSSFNVRLPEDLDRRLSRESWLTHRSRSELAREAIREYLIRMERDRFMERLGRAAQVIGNDPALRQEAEAIAEAFRPLEEEATGNRGNGSNRNTDEDGWWR